MGEFTHLCENVYRSASWIPLVCIQVIFSDSRNANIHYVENGLFRHSKCPLFVITVRSILKLFNYKYFYQRISLVNKTDTWTFNWFLSIWKQSLLIFSCFRLPLFTPTHFRKQAFWFPLFDTYFFSLKYQPDTELVDFRFLRHPFTIPTSVRKISGWVSLFEMSFFNSSSFL